MVRHPEIARWLVVAEQERQAELARRLPPRRSAARRHRQRGEAEGA